MTVGLGPPNPCFEGMAVVNSQEAWALASPNKTGQLIGLELAHTLGLTPPNRESPFDGAHSQNTTAENPPRTGATTSSSARSSRPTGA